MLDGERDPGGVVDGVHARVEGMHAVSVNIPVERIERRTAVGPRGKARVIATRDRGGGSEENDGIPGSDKCSQTLTGR